MTPHPIRTRATVKLHYRCNNRCLFCHAAGQPEPPRGQERILEKLGRLPAGVTQVLLSGGEPTIYPDLLPLLRHLKRLPLASGFISNGRMFSYPDFTRRVLSLDADYFYIALLPAGRAIPKPNRQPGNEPYSLHERSKSGYVRPRGRDPVRAAGSVSRLRLFGGLRRV